MTMQANKQNSKTCSAYDIMTLDLIEVTIEPGRDNRGVLRTSYNQDLINKLKSIPKRKWNPKGKYREVPLDKERV